MVQGKFKFQPGLSNSNSEIIKQVSRCAKGDCDVS